jgi:centrosomal protein CEP76
MEHNLRELIRKRVATEPIQDKIKQCVNELGGDDLKEGQLLQALNESGIIDDVITHITAMNVNKPAEKAPSLHVASIGQTSADDKHLQLTNKSDVSILFQVLQGRAFVDHLNESTELLPLNSPTFTVHLYHQDNHYRSSFTPCTCEPNFNQQFVLELNNNYSTELLTLSDPIYLVLTRNTNDGSVELVGTCTIDWRLVLASPNNKVTKWVELTGIKSDGRVPPGVICLQWELVPIHVSVDKSLLQSQLQLEHRKETERKRLFFIYSKNWWDEFISLRPNHSQRMVKIFAENERGDVHLVCSFVKPVSLGRVLDSPRHAGRFTSLFGLREWLQVGVSGTQRREEPWQTLPSFLATRIGVSMKPKQSYKLT